MSTFTPVSGQAWRVFVVAYSLPGDPPPIYDPELGRMARLLGIRVFPRTSFYEARFAVAGDDMATAMTVAAECWDDAVSALPLPAWPPHRVTVERVLPPMAPVLVLVESIDGPGPSRLTSTAVSVFA